jgi:hypothetical protein
MKEEVCNSRRYQEKGNVKIKGKEGVSKKKMLLQSYTFLFFIQS